MLYNRVPILDCVRLTTAIPEEGIPKSKRGSARWDEMTHAISTRSESLIPLVSTSLSTMTDVLVPFASNAQEIASEIVQPKVVVNDEHRTAQAHV